MHGYTNGTSKLATLRILSSRLNLATDCFLFMNVMCENPEWQPGFSGHLFSCQFSPFTGVFLLICLYVHVCLGRLTEILAVGVPPTHPNTAKHEFIHPIQD